MLKPRHNLRLPPWKTTGNLTSAGFSFHMEYGEQTSQSWKGRVVGKAADWPGHPVLWTPASVAGFRGLSVADYAIEASNNVAVARQLGKTPLTVPRMVIYSGFNDWAYDACVSLSSQLEARDAAAMRHPSALGMEGDGIVQVSGNVLAGVCAPTAVQSTTDSNVLQLPDADETRWLGGEVLVLCSSQIQAGLAAYSYSDTADPDDHALPDCVSRSRALYSRFQPRYHRLGAYAAGYAVVGSVTSPGDVARQTHAHDYHAAQFASAVSGMAGAVFDDLGVFDEDVSPGSTQAAVTAAFVAKIKSFFSIP